jgi:hypothetical protein
MTSTITPPDEVARIDLFASQHSPACGVAVQALKKHRIELDGVILLDTEASRQRAKRGNPISITRVPSLAVVGRRGDVQVYIGHTKISLWASTFARARREALEARSGASAELGAVGAGEGDWESSPSPAPARRRAAPPPVHPLPPEGFRPVRPRQYAGVDAAAEGAVLTIQRTKSLLPPAPPAPTAPSSAPASAPPPEPQADPHFEESAPAAASALFIGDDDDDGTGTGNGESPVAELGTTDAGADEFAATADQHLAHGAAHGSLNMKLGLGTPRNPQTLDIRAAAEQMKNERDLAMGADDGGFDGPAANTGPAGGGGSGGTIYKPDFS